MSIDVHIGSAPSPDGFDWIPVISLIPHLIWAAIIVFILFWIGRDGFMALTRRIHKVGAVGFEIEFQAAIESAAAAHQLQIPMLDLSRASRRLASQQALLKGSRLLWVDDQPKNNRNEKKLFEAVGARVDTSSTSAAAEAAIMQVTYDLIISDIDREGSATEGLQFLGKLTKVGNSPPLLFYVGQARNPPPAEAFGIADRPDELVHLVLDVLGRSRS